MRQHFFESHAHHHAGNDFGHGGHGFRAGGRRHGGPMGRGGHGDHGGRGGNRVFDHGELRLVVLALIAETPRHGYEIIKAIEERLAGSYSPSPGVIYPTLTLLQELGHATVEENDGKKRYSITDEGRRYIAENRKAVDAALARMREVSERLGGGPAPQIIRAMENLKLALRMRMNRGPLTQVEVQGIAAALDAAAVNVERS